MTTSLSDYHTHAKQASNVVGDLLVYDDFELKRRTWADERLRLQIAGDETLRESTQVSSLATLDCLNRSMERELQRAYRKQARLRGESDAAYDALTARIDTVKSRLSIQEYVEAASPRTLLSVRGPRLVGHCPYHEEKSPSFVIYPDEHAWCFGCQRGGDLFDVIGLIEGMDRFYDQLKYAEYFLGIAPEVRSPRPANTDAESARPHSRRPAPFEPIRIGPNGRVAR